MAVKSFITLAPGRLFINCSILVLIEITLWEKIETLKENLWTLRGGICSIYSKL
jgi:hypothetical protein